MLQSVQEGGDHPRLDQIEKIVHYPRRKIGAWFGKKHDPIQEEVARRQAVEASIAFLSANNLADVNIETRYFAPGEQWRRLRENDEIRPIWKYTDGAARVLGSTIFPSRVFHYDVYNPYTKTLSIDSLSQANGVYNAATAKYYLAAPMPGALATAQHLPLVPIWHRSKIASESIAYSKASDDRQLEKEMYPMAYRRVGASLLTEVYAVTPFSVSSAIWVSPALSMAGRGLGQSIGTFQAKRSEAARTR